MLRAFVSALAVLTATTLAATTKPAGGVSSAACPPDPCAAYSPVPFYRAFNKAKIDHLYTTDITEIVVSPDYALEGIAGRVLATNITGTAALYRLFNPTVVDHLYTVNVDERDAVLAASEGWVDQGVAGYIPVTPQCGTVPFSRAVKGDVGDHFYTGDVAELIRTLNGFGYTWESVVGFIWPA